MKLSTKGRYAVMAMLELAMNEKEGPVNLTDISKSQGISLSYLEQLFANLRKKGLVKGRRGPGGGYRLGLPPQNISIAQVVKAVNEPKSSSRQALEGEYGKMGDYVPFKLWINLSDKIYSFLSGISLADCTSELVDPETGLSTRKGGKTNSETTSLRSQVYS